MSMDEKYASSSEKAYSQHPATSNIESWVSIREKRVTEALEHDDMTTLREISALPGGFGSEDMRRRVWPVLLRTNRFFDEDEAESSSSSSKKGHKLQSAVKSNGEQLSSEDIDSQAEVDEAEDVTSQLPHHKDENQVKLDTRRAFVTYPRGLRAESKLKLQEDLHDLIVGVLRRYPPLSYFQGYHDILSVLYLTFIPPDPTPQSRSISRNKSSRKDSSSGEKARLADSTENDRKGGHQFEARSPPYTATDRDTESWRILRRCAEAVSLNRVRDAMGTGMEGMMGLLRILKRILRAADPELSRFSALISPVPTLPFFALSWVLTLFSHDCDSLEPVQRMFDFLLARNPISAVYLAAAILIAKKPQMFDMAKKLGSEYQDDPSLLHPLFVRLPPLYSDTPSSPDPPIDTGQNRSGNGDRDLDDEPNPYKPIRLSELFRLADELITRYPWDGDVIRGKEIMGEGSVVQSYTFEMSSEAWTPAEAVPLVDKEVVKPGAGSAEDEEEEEVASKPRITKRKIRLPLRIPRNKLSTAWAVGVVLVGVGIALYGIKAGGRDASWGRWWAMVIRGWVGKEGRKVVEASKAWAGTVGYVGRSMRDLL